MSYDATQMPSEAKQVTLAELQKLQSAWNANPNSDAYRPLAEGLAGMGRYLEAAVVCSKAIKAHPQSVAPRLLLAQLYIDQKKDRKAIETLQEALTVAPTDKVVLRTLSLTQFNAGETESAKASLIRAYDSDQSDPVTLAAMAKFGVSPPKPKVAAPPARVRAPAPSGFDGSATIIDPRPGDAGASAPGTSRPSSPRMSRPSRPPMAVDYKPEPAIVAPASPRSSRTAFFLLLLVVPLGVAGYFIYGQYRAKQTREAVKLLRDALDNVKSDTFSGYQKAITSAENALSIDSAQDMNRQARGLLAYAYIVRWAEHQPDDANRDAALANLKAGVEAQEGTSFLNAADALESYYSGNSDGALKKLEEKINAAQAEKRQVPLYYLTRGIIQTNTGALEDARVSLEKAQSITPDDPRIYVALGNLQHRRGADPQALQAFNSALKFSRNAHPEALLGTVGLILDQDDPQRSYLSAATYLKSLLDADPPPSPRQLAKAHFLRAFLLSRVAKDLPLYKDDGPSGAFKKELREKVGVAAEKDIAAEESAGLSLDPKNPDLLIIRAHRLSWEGKHDEAAAAVRSAIEMDKGDAQYQVELARILLKKPGGDAQAEESLKKALTMLQDSPRLLTMLAQVQYREKKPAEAIATLGRALKDDTQRVPDARALLATILRDDTKDVEGAIKNFERAATEYVGDSTKASAASADAASLYDARGKDGDRDKARAAYEQALSANKSNASAYCKYAKFLSHGDANDKTKAKTIAGEALKLEPSGACASDMQALK